MVYLFLLLIITAFIFQNPRFKGFIGEGRVRFPLKKFDTSTNHIVLHDILLPSRDGKTTQIDHLILSIYGFLIEKKSFINRFFKTMGISKR
ncbi:nuclease-related domain-containing protein [Robertmurraya kyonggiensis]|uniref:nuclease-related domain-containing protein n=1 Tax=Robertmurraya kyonggiensis TaxID=1037680 RepID=UPI00130E1CF0|nr:nuclease-related domain-containing protein [Robertmurraya kyonggiensis]